VLAPVSPAWRSHALTDPKLSLNNPRTRLRRARLDRTTQAYNLGTLTLKRCSLTPNDKRHDVVDGQQRLTSLSLIIAAVKQHLDDAEANGACICLPPPDAQL
jgi:hypothetical protein